MKLYAIEDGVTQSMLADWLACRQRTKFQLEGWESGGPSKLSLELGTMWHGVMEAAYGLLIPGPTEVKRPRKKLTAIKNVLKQAAEEMAARMVGLLPQWLEQLRPEPGASRLDVQDEELMLSIVQSLFAPYLEHWLAKDLPLSWTAVESTFDVTWRGFRLRGKRDGLFRRGKELWLVERKTRSDITETTLLDQLAFDAQNLFYLTATEEEVGEVITGVLYDVVRVPQLRQGKEESVGDFMNRIAVDVKSRPDHYFARYEINYNRATVLTYQTQLANKLDDFRTWVGNPASTYRNEGSCVTRFTCEFLKACASCSMAGFTQSRTLFRELEG